MPTGKRFSGLVAGALLFVVLLVVPAPEGMSASAMKVAALTALMATWWITEAIPIPVTSLLPIVLLPLLGVSNSGAATAPYAHPLVFLFLGGFLLARAMEVHELHRRIALETIALVGSTPERIVLGFMIATAVLSMCVSNTACAMMMVPIGSAVIARAQSDDKAFGTALMLGIAYAASIGGVATLIGTPPNVVMAGMLDQMYGVKIGFASWMLVGVPLSVVMLGVTWWLLVRVIYRPASESIGGARDVLRAERRQLGPISRGEKRVLAIFATVALAWILRGLVPLPEALAAVDDTTIAIAGALALFVVPSGSQEGALLAWKDARDVPWGVLLLFGGGLSLAGAFSSSGLAAYLAGRFASLEGVAGVVAVGAVVLFTIFLTEVTSNTAVATLMTPILGPVALVLGVHPVVLIAGACMAASYAFMLPVATPPNAVVFASGTVTIRQMARAGFLLNLTGAILITAVAWWLIPLAIELLPVAPR